MNVKAGTEQEKHYYLIVGLVGKQMMTKQKSVSQNPP